MLLKLDPPRCRDHPQAPAFGVYEIGISFANVDITKEPIPVVPTIHQPDGRHPDQHQRPRS